MLSVEYQYIGLSFDLLLANKSKGLKLKIKSHTFTYVQGYCKLSSVSLKRHGHAQIKNTCYRKLRLTP